MQAGPVLCVGGMGAFFKGTSSEKRTFCVLAPPKQMPVLTISYKNMILSRFRALDWLS